MNKQHRDGWEVLACLAVLAVGGGPGAVLGQEKKDAAVPVAVNQQLVAQVTHLGRAGEMGNLEWSPDGQQVAFLKGYPAKVTDKQEVQVTEDGIEGGTFTFQFVAADLWVARADGSAPRQLTRFEKGQKFDFNSLEGGPRCAMAPRWSPDGKMLAYLSGMMMGGQLTLLDVATGQPRSLPYGAMAIMSGMRWSPDGQWLAFSGADWKTFAAGMLGASCPLALVRTDGQGYRQIADAQFAEVGEWSPDGSQLLYVRWKSLEESEGLWVAKWDGSLPRQLVPHLERPGTWSPDGRWIAYAGNDQAPGLWLLNVATLERQQVVPQPVSWVQWVRAGPGIFYLQGEAGQADLWLLRAKDRQRQQLTTSGNVAEAVASPTGQQVAVVVSRESRGDKDFFGREDTYILTLKGEAAP